MTAPCYETDLRFWRMDSCGPTRPSATSLCGRPCHVYAPALAACRLSQPRTESALAQIHIVAGSGVELSVIA